MAITIKSISNNEAMQIVQSVLAKAGADGGTPIAVAVVDVAGRLKAFSAMDGVMPASIKLAQSKAYSAVAGQHDTIHWATFPKNEQYVDFDMRNWTDENFSGFTGGLVIMLNGQIIGGIGLSGRKGKKGEGDLLLQDNELAEFGRDSLAL